MTRGKLGLFLAITTSLAVTACSDAADPPAAPLQDAGSDARGARAPALPPECAIALPETVIDTDLAGLYVPRLRAVGDTLYFQLADGIHATTVPGGADRLVLPGPVVPSSQPGKPPTHASFADFWLDGSSITGVLGETIYSASIEGGPLLVTVGTPPASRDEATVMILEHGAYVRSGDDLYHATDTATSWWPGHSLRRASRFGGVWAEVLPPDAIGTPTLQIDDRFLYYFDLPLQATYAQSLFQLELGQSTPTKRASAFLRPIFNGFDGSLYVSEERFGGGTLWRVRADAADEELLSPPGVLVWSPQNFDHPQLRQGVLYKGSLYLALPAVYQLPDDRRLNDRYVVVRIDPHGADAALVSCLPDLAIDPEVPRDTFTTSLSDIAATEDGVFVTLSRRDNRALRERTSLFRVTP